MRYSPVEHPEDAAFRRPSLAGINEIGTATFPREVSRVLAPFLCSLY
jgi:hypothetical protein